MTPEELVEFRDRMGWTQSELARQLEMSLSRIQDYEIGWTRSRTPRPAPIPKVVVLALRWLQEHHRPSD